MSIYLDTHVVVWLHAGEVDRLSPSAKTRIEDDDIVVSPAVLLELKLLQEIGRITSAPGDVFLDLQTTIGLAICPKRFSDVIQQAVGIGLTRDPFDRMIIGHAAIGNEALVTKDREIRANYANALW